MEEQSIIERCRSGEREVYAVLVDRYQAMVINVAFRMMGDAEAARDIAQDSFIAAYSAINDFRSGSKFSTWLCSIAMNKCRDQLRLRKNAIPLEDVAETAASKGPDPESSACARQETDALQAALRALPADYREAVVLKHIEGLEYREMEAILGVSANALKVRTHRARELLRKYMTERGHDNG